MSEASNRRISPNDRVRVLFEYDLPPMLRPDGLPSEGVVERIHEDGTLVVIVDGKAVPYQPHEVEVV
jgi:hypothetical protein